MTCGSALPKPGSHQNLHAILKNNKSWTTS
jgi:hypothetical protein